MSACKNASVGLLVAAVCLLTACGDSDGGVFDSTTTPVAASTGEPVPFQTLENAWGLQVPRAGTSVFRDAATWEAFWRRHSDRPVPPVDFERVQVVVVYWGLRSGCSDRAEFIREVRRFPSVIQVHVSPWVGTDCLTLVSPLQAITLERSDLPIRFHGEVPGRRASR